MAAKPTLEESGAYDEAVEDVLRGNDEGEESDEYEIEGEEDADDYHPEEEEEDEDDGGEVGEIEPGNLTAELLVKQNGADVEEYDEDDEDDDEYQEDGEGTVENPIDLASAVAGSKRGRGDDELAEGDADGDADEETEGETATKKARV